MEQEVEQWEELPLPRFEGKLVHVHGVWGTVEAGNGTRLPPNGLSGRAVWDDLSGLYAIRTFEGHQFSLPEENLQEFVRMKPEDGGFDYAWPEVGQEEEFSVKVADTIRKKGYVVIQMFEGDELRKDAKQAALQREWLLPKPEFEEAYLGRDASSKVSMIRQEDPPDTPIEFYNHQVKMVAAALYGLVEDYFGFRPDNYRSGTMVRTSLKGPAEREMLSPGPLEQPEVDEGQVENHLDFVRRRRLCIMYLVDNQGGILQLHPREDLNQSEIVLPLSKDKIVVFRHDLIGYTYKPAGLYDLVVQSWFMEEQQKLRLDGFQGTQESLQELMGIHDSIPIEAKRQVHIMGGNCRFGGASWRMDRYWTAFSQSVDGFICIPLGRWDMEPYYNPDSEQFGAQGKSVTKHAGMMSDDELLSFDNDFFGIDKEAAHVLAPSQRILLEISYEALHMVGYESLSFIRGERIALINAECGLDHDYWHRFRQNADAWLQGQNTAGVSANIVAFHFGTTGPVAQVDTACSSSLVSHNISHALLRRLDDKGVDQAMSMGAQCLLNPWGFLGLSGAGMLGRSGRCLTFDNSANGMARAEGVGGLFLKATSDPSVVAERLGVYVSSFVNQDGRSASLTAPNGPSQQLCMRSSMKDGNLSPSSVHTNENHGTGTALGDPIETGSAKAIFRLHGGQIPITSSKSNLGHMETTAGSNGLIRTLTTLLHGTTPPTVHVHTLNQHIEQEGFPGCFPTECLDLGRKQNVGGLNSFGFGGTNSRAELWASAIYGPRETDEWFQRLDKRHSRAMSMDYLRRFSSVGVTCPSCFGPMCWLCGAALPVAQSAGEQHICSTLREEHASYDSCSSCYEGGYKIGQPAVDVPDRGHKIYIAGSWNVWTSPLEMIQEGDGIYTANVVLGDTCVEEFHLLLERDKQRALFPVVHRASCRARVAGPAKAEPGKNWLIDGRRDGAQTGSVYKVRLAWTDARRKVYWARQGRNQEAVGSSHSYSILSSLSHFRPEDMKQSPRDPFCWEFTGRMTSKEATFMIQRDNDAKQLIYPSEHRPTHSSVPVAGPDAGTGIGKNTRLWCLRGQVGDNMMVRLRIRDGDVEVTANSEENGQISWQNQRGSSLHRYYLRSSWSPRVEEMEPDMADLDVYRLTFTLPELGYGGKGNFQIVVDKDETQVIHPGHNLAAAGQALVDGPDDKGDGLFWEVNGPLGLWFEVVLDLRAEDKRKMVTCRPIGRMKSLASH